MSLPDGFSTPNSPPSGKFTRRHSFVVPFPPLPTPFERTSDRAVVAWVAGDMGYRWFSITGPAMERHASSIGADLVVLEGFTGQPYMLANKFRVGQVFDEYGYEEILYVDGDILLKPDCENFFETVPKGHVGILDEGPLYDYWMLAHFRHEAAELLESQGFDPRRHRIPTPKNAGFYLIRREHRAALTPFARPFPLCYRNGATVEQTWFCLMLEHHCVPIHSFRFPEQHWLWYLDQHENSTERSSVLHFCGMPDPDERFERLAVNASQMDDSGSGLPSGAVVQAMSAFDSQMMLDHEAEPALKMRDNFVISSHQYGWEVALKSLSVLSNHEGVLFDGFVEKTFLWDRQRNIAAGKIPYREPWIGIVHHPPEIPDWPSLAHHRIQELASLPQWEQSLDTCVGLIALSDHLARWVTEQWGIHCDVLRYPALRPDKLFSLDKFDAQPMPVVAMVGFWMRRFTSFSRLRARGYRKVRPLLVEDPNSPGMDHVRRYEREEEAAATDTGVTGGEVEVITRRSNDEYDELLSQSVVFLDLAAASAVTTVVECLTRTTPLLINRLPAVVEYLGGNYPLFYDSLEDAERLLNSRSAIVDAHQHMVDNPVRKQLTPQSFLDGFVNTRAYQRALWTMSVNGSSTHTQLGAS